MANRNGTPIWFELNTPDAAAAEDFYTAVVGWSVAPSPMAEHGGYRIASAPSGTGVAGIMTPPPQAPAHPGWSIYFGVDDVDGVAARVNALGGAIVFGPMDIPHVGRFAVATDPQGIAFFIMTGSSPEDSRAFLQAPDCDGHGVWIELATPDPDGAFAFYGALFDWTKSGAMPMGDMGEYAFIGASDAPAGQQMGFGAVMSSTATGAPPRWNWYVHVPDIDSALASATDAEGSVLQGPDQIPGGEYSANVADPHGNPIGLVGARKEA